jgi:hypothetical protein
MKQFKKIGLIALAAAAFLGCEKDKPITPEMALTPVYVESGRIQNDSLFVSNRPFDADDTAVGMIDSTDCATINGYADKEGWIYVFEGGRPPQRALNDSDYDRFKYLTEANWQNDYVYNLKLDAEICTIAASFKIYVREKGDYQRQKAVIYNTNVYRFKNRYVVEDYSLMLDRHEYLHPSEGSKLQFDYIAEKSREQFSIRVESSTLKMNTTLGTIDFVNSLPTPAGITDKIYVTHNSGFPVYRFRHVLFQYTAIDIRNFFGDSRTTRVRADLRNIWTEADTESKRNFKRYLNTVIANHLEPTVTGYSCSSCSASSRSLRVTSTLNSPPLPELTGTFQ